MSQVVERNNSDGSAMVEYNLNDGGVVRLRDRVTSHSIAATEYVYIYCVLPRGLMKSRPTPKQGALWLFFRYVRGV